MNADLLPVLAGVAARGAVVLLFAWGLTAVMRRASASARHLVWSCALAASLLVPAAALMAPRWQVESPVPLTTRSAPSVTTTPIRQAAPLSHVSSTSAPTPARGASFTVAQIAVMVWAAGAIGVLLYLCAGFVSARRIRRRATAAAQAALDQIHALAEAFEIAQPIAIVHADAATTPMVIGIWRPAIVMPPDMAAWSETRRHVVLLHELAHVKRRDCLTQTLAQVVCAAYWFNPLAWIAARRLRAERERACDDFVLAAGTRGSDYATHLLEIAQQAPARFSPIAAASVAMARRSQLEGRLMAILDPAIRRSSALRTRFAALTLVALMSIPVAAVQLVSPADTRVATDTALPAVTRAEVPAITAEVQSAQAPARAAAQQEPARPTLDARLRATLNRTLVQFAEDGDVEGVLAMLDAGADVNAAIEGDGSPLIAAAEEGQLDMVRLLLDKGAAPNLIVDGDGTALIAAAEEGHLDVVRLLLDRKADPNLIADGDGTALIAAAGEGHIDVVELLLARGAQVNLVAEGDETALIQASGEGDLAMVKLLVSKGADVNLGVQVETVRWDRESRFPTSRDFRQTELRTPLSEAREDRHLDVVTFLISAGARD